MPDVALMEHPIRVVPRILVGLVEKSPRRQCWREVVQVLEVCAEVGRADGHQELRVLLQNGTAGSDDGLPVLQLGGSIDPAWRQATLVVEGGGRPLFGAALPAPRLVPGSPSAHLPRLVSEPSGDDGRGLGVAPGDGAPHVNPTRLRIVSVEPQTIAVVDVAAPVGGMHVVVQKNHDPLALQCIHDTVEDLQCCQAKHAGVRGHSMVIHCRIPADHFRRENEPHDVEAELADEFHDVPQRCHIEAPRNIFPLAGTCPIDAPKADPSPRGIHDVTLLGAQRHGRQIVAVRSHSRGCLVIFSTRPADMQDLFVVGPLWATLAQLIHIQRAETSSDALPAHLGSHICGTRRCSLPPAHHPPRWRRAEGRERDIGDGIRGRGVAAQEHQVPRL
mmetsp:Transcript_47776/g.153901  ORF Transcript_47776/g.153901 Transcript_47776/m.153901 type:complete len:389 (-) Transcript_47776:289-1455(-)